jgi:hypothetical protein
MESNIFMIRRTNHATWFMTFHTRDIRLDKVERFIRESSSKLKVDFACVTMLTPEEIRAGRANKTVWPLDRKGKELMFAIYSQFLQKCIPDVYWITVFGEPYIEIFGRESLLAAPAFRTEALDDGRVLLQITPTLDDVAVNPIEFSAKKGRIKEFLGAEAFFSPAREGECKRPTFEWK